MKFHVYAHIELECDTIYEACERIGRGVASVRGTLKSIKADEERELPSNVRDIFGERAR